MTDYNIFCTESGEVIITKELKKDEVFQLRRVDGKR